MKEKPLKTMAESTREEQQQSVHLRCLELFRLARWASCGSYSPEGQQQEEPLMYNVSLGAAAPDDRCDIAALNFLASFLVPQTISTGLLSFQN